MNESSVNRSVIKGTFPVNLQKRSMRNQHNDDLPEDYFASKKTCIKIIEALRLKNSK